MCVCVCDRKFFECVHNAVCSLLTLLTFNRVQSSRKASPHTHTLTHTYIQNGFAFFTSLQVALLIFTFKKRGLSMNYSTQFKTALSFHLILNLKFLKNMV